MSVDQATALPLAGPALRAGTTSRAVEIRVVWRAFWRSRVLIWGAGCLAVLILGVASGSRLTFDPAGISSSFGSAGNVLAAPAVRWDAIWYLDIAQHGYHSARDTAFFPLYPLLVRAGSLVTRAPVPTAILISLVSLFVALVLIRRLTELELGSRTADLTVQLVAFGPMALFLSAIYTDSLFLALSAGTFYAARRGRWAAAGVIGAIAATTREGGSLLIAPVLLMFFYGPRSDMPPPARSTGWRPRYQFKPAVLWSLLIPAGGAAFAGFLALKGYGVLGNVHAQEQYSAHQVTYPWVGLWEGIKAAWQQLGLDVDGYSPAVQQSQALFQALCLAGAVVATCGVFRRLPLAYGTYVTLAILMHLSTPTIGDPLKGFDRYASLRFPLFMWAASWAVERRAVRGVVLASGILLVLFTVQFATWHVVGSSYLGFK